MSRRLRLGVDMDGVLANFSDASLRMIKEVWNIDFKKEDIKIPRTADLVYYKLFDNHQRAQYPGGPRDLYNIICPPEFFYELEPFEGAIETLKMLCEKYDVTIITKPLEWVHCPDEKARWLEKYLPDSTYELVMVGSMEVKGLLDVDIMIDDDTRVIKSLNGAVPIVVRQPWNEEYLKLESDYAVDNFSEVPAIIEEVLESIWLH